MQAKNTGPDLNRNLLEPYSCYLLAVETRKSVGQARHRHAESSHDATFMADSPAYGAPADSQAATIARSSEVISVTLPGGIAFAHAALRPISCALRLMCAASSSRMPLGAVTIEAQTGSAA